MNRIDAAFRRLKASGGKALIPYLTAGYPSAEATRRLMPLLEKAGADLIEIGIPFSDPLADGPTIQAASARALKGGMNPARVLALVRRLRGDGVRVPLVLMTYINPVARFGVSAFCREAAGAGADGLIVPDLPPEEADELLDAARPHGLKIIFLAAPTSPPKRLRAIARRSGGFIYYVSLTGVTGARDRLDPGIGRHVQALRRLTRLPLCVGFGISAPGQVRRVARIADGVIVGSALLNVIGRPGGGIQAAVRFVRKLKDACVTPESRHAACAR